MKKKKCSEEHFIQAIRGGLVLNVMNRDSHGQPAQKFKRFKDICESEEARKLYIASSVEEHQEGILRSEPSGTKKCATTSNSDDDNIVSMTLKEMREMRKTKKRKLSESDENSSPGCIKPLVKEEKVEYPFAPSGFESLTSFTLKKIDTNEVIISTVPSGSDLGFIGSEGGIGDSEDRKNFLRRRPWINYIVG